MKTEQEWQEAEKYFYQTMRQYEGLRGMPGVNVELALTYVFEPIAGEFENGGRTDDLYDSMINVE